MAAPIRTLLRASLPSISRPTPGRSTRVATTLFARQYSHPSPPNPPPPPPPTPKPIQLSPPTPVKDVTSKFSSVPSLDFDSEESSQASQFRTGARSAGKSKSSLERKRQRLSLFGMGLFFTGLMGGYIYNGLEPDEKIDSAASSKLGAWISRSNKRSLSIFTHFNEPIWEKLLPPPFPPPYQKPYTLVLSIDDLLVASVWDRQNGWRTAKRPGVDYFLGYLSQFYEIVIFTTQSVQTAWPIMDKLDPFQFSVLYQLYRESTHSVNGKIVKDLSYLNRDLSRVISIDTVAERYALQPENAIILPKWKGDPKDTGLVGLIPFLESIGILNPPDVRPILNAYKGKDIATEYAKIEAANKARLLEEWKAKHPTNSGSNLGGFTLSHLFNATATPSTVDESGMPLTYLEQRRKMEQQRYQGDREYLRQNEASLLKQKEEDMERQMKEVMSEGLWGALGRMGVAPQPPPRDGPDATRQPSQAAGKVA